MITSIVRQNANTACFTQAVLDILYGLCAYKPGSVPSRRNVLIQEGDSHLSRRSITAPLKRYFPHHFYASAKNLIHKRAGDTILLSDRDLAVSLKHGANTMFVRSRQRRDIAPTLPWHSPQSSLGSPFLSDWASLLAPLGLRPMGITHYHAVNLVTTIRWEKLARARTFLTQGLPTMSATIQHKDYPLV